jgi:hypothetical protein
MMQYDDEAAGQLFTPPRSSASSNIGPYELVTSGYSVKCGRGDQAKILPAYVDLFTSLGTNAGVVTSPRNGHCRDNLEVQYLHEYTTRTQDRRICPASYAEFYSFVNKTAGLLIADNNFGPAYMHAVQSRELVSKALHPPLLPTLHKFSDAAYLQWSLGFPSPPSDLRYVLRAHITNPDTLAIMRHVLSESAEDYFIPPPHERKRLRWTAQDERPRWPGVVFDMKKDKARALLGTPNGSGVAWLSIQRKRELGHKIVKRVTVFFTEHCGENGRWVELPNLLFHIGGV